MGIKAAAIASPMSFDSFLSRLSTAGLLSEDVGHKFKDKEDCIHKVR